MEQTARELSCVTVASSDSVDVPATTVKLSCLGNVQSPQYQEDSMVTLENWRAHMSEDMRLRDFRPRTQEGYSAAVRQFLDHVKREPETLSDRDVRDYFIYLREGEKLAPSSIIIAVHALSERSNKSADSTSSRIIACWRLRRHARDGHRLFCIRPLQALDAHHLACVIELHLRRS